MGGHTERSLEGWSKEGLRSRTARVGVVGGGRSGTGSTVVRATTVGRRGTRDFGGRGWLLCDPSHTLFSVTQRTYQCSDSPLSPQTEGPEGSGDPTG